MKIGLYDGKKKFNLHVRNCNSFQMIRGLMFRRREKAKALLFDFKTPVNMSIHSLFVFFHFLAVWLDNKNNIMEIRLIEPFQLSVSPKNNFFKLIEIPCNEKYKDIIKKLNSRR